MNWYLWLFGLLAVLLAAFLIIIRDAITIDGPKAKAALRAFAARFKRNG